jgi:hypothetical protein
MLPNKDLKYLIVGYEEISEKKIEAFVVVNENDLRKAYDEIFNDYSATKFDRRELLRMKEEGEIIYLNSTYEIIVKTLALYKEYEDIKILEIFVDLEFTNFDINGDIKKEIEKIVRSAKGLKNKINIKRINYEKKYLKGVEDKMDVQDVFKTLDKQALALETNLELGYKINVKKTSVVRWLNLIDRHEKVIEQYG